MGLPAAIGPYAVVRELGRGGMGVVYEVRHPRIPRPLALKMLLDPSERSAERFTREAQALARVKHPNVVGVLTFDRAPQGPYLVTELVEGTSLRALSLPLEFRRAAQVVRALADALAAVHAAGVLHRDLKPENAILRPDGTPVLLDFGLAREHEARTLTEEGALLGTPAYMAPEQLGDGKAVDARADVYGLGAVLLFLLTGAPPFAGAHLEVLTKVLRAEPTWPAAAPPGLVAVVRRAMAKDRDARPASAAALRAELDRWLEAGDARPAPGQWACAGALLVAAALLVALVALWPAPRPEVQPPIAASTEAPPVQPAPVASADAAPSPSEALSAPTARVLDLADEFLEARPLVWEEHDGPPARDNIQGAMAWDGKRQRVWLYGGFQRKQPPAPSITLADLWSWDGERWKEHDLAGGPGPRFGHSVVYDEARDALVVLGGRIDANHARASTDVWELDLATRTWSQRQVPPGAGPEQRTWAAAAYSSHGKVTLLFGGALSQRGEAGDDGEDDEPKHDTYPGGLWAWNGARWRQLCRAGRGTPNGRVHAACTYHAGSFYVQGGRGPRSSYLGGTWRWDGAAWSVLAAYVDAPEGLMREGHVLVHDGERLLVHGGRHGNRSEQQRLFDDLWAYDGEGWRVLPLQLPRPQRRAFHGGVFDPVRRRLVIFGGSEWGWTGTSPLLPPRTWTFPVDAARPRERR